MTAQPSTSIVSRVVTAAIFLSTSFVLPICALSQDNIGADSERDAVEHAVDYPNLIREAYEEYEIHDIEEEDLGQGVLWTFQWLYDREALNELIPLYGYDFELLLTESDSSSPGTTHPGTLCDDPTLERELSFLSALFSGQSTWSPADYVLGLTGIATQSQISSGAIEGPNYRPEDLGSSDHQEASDGSLRAFLSNQNVQQYGSEESAEGVTLAVACQVMPDIREVFAGDVAGSESGDGTWYFIAQYPIPDFEPARLLWTNPITDVVQISGMSSE
ncbi:MAG: hypothetical protein OXK82_02595 [Deltaproteobacteria bacterium]|nr:hypothetical protein [Deltaproteobacteria bacterium]